MLDRHMVTAGFLVLLQCEVYSAAGTEEMSVQKLSTMDRSGRLLMAKSNLAWPEPATLRHLVQCCVS